MEHSYSRDWKTGPDEENSTLPTRTLMIHRPPQCPSCHIHPSDERVDLDEFHNPSLPTYDEKAAKASMVENEYIAKSIKNINTDDDCEWEEKILKVGWTMQQLKLFNRICKVLDLDRLSRLANTDKPHEPVQRRVVIDRSVQRLRQALASVTWNVQLTQWIHGLLLDNLPSNYLGGYLDILQSLRAKVPTLTDKMINGRQGPFSQEIFTAITRKPWELVVTYKNRKLPGPTYIVVVPSAPTVGAPSPRIQKWYSLFATMASVVPIQVPATNTLQKQGLECVTEQMVAITRAKIQDSRSDSPGRHIILVGFNAGAALALQVALVENVNCVISIGFACNTVNGIRGAADDDILDLTTPVLFAIGQNSARSSQEEIAALREKMLAQTSLVVVGSADDNLRVSKTKRKIEGITQYMVDNMVMDEIAEFAKNCIINPPKPKPASQIQKMTASSSTNMSTVIHINRKRKNIGSDFGGTKPKISKPVGRPKSRHLNPPPQKYKKKELNLIQPTGEALNIAIQSILPVDDNKMKEQTVTTYDISPDNSLTKTDIRTQTISGKAGNPIILPMMHRTQSHSSTPTISQVKVLPPNQFIHLKPTIQTQQKFVTLKTTPAGITVSGPKSATQQYITVNSNKFFTMKSTPTATTTSSGITYSPTKFKILKSGPTEAIGKSESTSNLSETDIFDMPIVFADNEGNIQDQEASMLVDNSISDVASLSDKSATDTATPQSSPSSTSTISSIPVQKPPQKLIMQPIRTALGDNSGDANKNKVVMIKSALKPGTTIIGKNILSNIKYTKVVLNNSSIAKQLLQDTNNAIAKKTVTISAAASKNLTNLVKGNKIEILNNSMLRSANNTVAGTSVATTSIGTSKFQPIVINVDSDKTTVKNMIRICTTGSKVNDTTKFITTSANSGLSFTPNPTNTIVIKPENFKDISKLKSNILNRTVTVRKIVNLTAGSNQQKATLIPVSSTGNIISMSIPATTIVSSTAASAQPSTSSSVTTDATKKI